jgi:hypothetical protein
MAQDIDAPVRTVQADLFSKLNLTFDTLELIVERAKRLSPGVKDLISAAKDILVLLFILLLLIRHCIHFLFSG